MAFEISRIKATSPAVEIASYKGSVANYLMQIASHEIQKRKQQGRIDPEMASQELADHYLTRVLEKKMHGLLAYETNRDEKGKIVVPSFTPLGHMLFSIRKPEERDHACIDQLLTDDRTGSVDILLMHRFMEDLKRLRGQNPPKKILMKTLLRDNTHLENYGRIGFCPIEVIEGGKVLVWQADYAQLMLR